MRLHLDLGPPYDVLLDDDPLKSALSFALIFLAAQMIFMQVVDRVTRGKTINRPQARLFELVSSDEEQEDEIDIADDSGAEYNFTEMQSTTHPSSWTRSAVRSHSANSSALKLLVGFWPKIGVQAQDAAIQNGSENIKTAYK